MLFKINKAVLEYEGNGIQVLLSVVKVIKDFDKSLGGIDNEDFEKTMETCGEIVWWLFLATKGKIKSIPTIGCSNKSVRRKFESIEASLEQKLGSNTQQHNQNSQIADLSASFQRPLETIASSSSSTQDFISKLTQLQLAS